MRSPFTGFRFARLEFNNFRAGTMMKLAIIGISFIPLIYGGLFLLAFLDPYGSLSNVPAAVVNLDTGAKINGEQKNVGNELCDSLVENNENAKEGEASGYNWTFVDKETADRGLEDATYYMELIIPENFSESIASADSADPDSAELEVYFNPSTNLIAQTVGSSMVTKIKSELNTKVEKEYFDNIFLKIEDASDGFNEAGDGAQKLGDGIEKLEAGSSDLEDGLSDAVEGSQKITDNLGTLADGADSVDEGVGKVSSGLKQLKAGISAAQDSTSDFSTTVTGVANALTAYSKTSDESYLTKAKKLSAKAAKQNPTIGSQLNKYVKSLVNKIQAYSKASSVSSNASKTMATKKAAMDKKKTAMESAQGGIAQPAANLQKAAGALQSDLGSSNGLGASLSQFSADYQKYVTTGDQTLVPTLLKDSGALASSASSVVSGSTSGSGPELLIALSEFQTALSKYQSAATDYQDAAAEYQTAANVYSTAATKMATAGAEAKQAQGNCEGYLRGVANTSKYASKSTASVSAAVNKLYKAVSGDLSDGTSALASGADKLESGSSTLTKGLKTAESGSRTITLNLGKAYDGANELSESLYEGADTVDEQLVGKEDKAAMMAEPVTANGDSETGESITHVANYGTGFAPYFIGLGAWVGALMVSMLIRCLNNRILMSGASSIAAVLSSYIPITAVCILQEMMLLLFVQFGLGMEIKYPLAFYLFGVLTAMSFAAIIQFCRASMGTVGMVVVVIALMLQLCTAAGTFPIQAELPVFNWLNPFLPMTYVVQGFRMAMAGLSLDYFWPACVVLFVYMVAFLLFTYLYARRRRRVTMSQLYPPIKLASG